MPAADTANRLGLPYFDAFPKAINYNDALLCDDHTHPNDDGHRALADAILPTCRSLQLQTR